MLKNITLTLLFFFGFFSVVNSQTIVTDRPDQTESSLLVPKNSLQIEAGLLFINDDVLEGSSTPSILFRYGLSEIFELRLVTEYISLKNKTSSASINGVADIQIGTKINILNKKESTTKIAFLSHLIIPTAKEGLTNDDVGVINKLAISHPLTETISVGYNIGYDYFGVGSGDLTYSISLATSITDKLGVYVEPYGLFSDFNNHISNFDFGFTYLLKDNLQFDISYGTGLNNSLNYYAIGASWNISNL